MSSQVQHLYEFGPFLLDTSERRLLRDGESLKVTPKAFETLVALVERKGRLVSKDELMKSVWADAHVEESNLTNNVYALRKMLGKDESGRHYIETVPKRGYRFTAGVRELPQEGEELTLERHTYQRITTEEEVRAGEEGEVTRLSGRAPLAVRNDWRAVLKRRVISACALLGLLVAGVLGAIYQPWASRSAAKAEVNSVATPKSIAVLPFKTIGPEGQDEYLGLGMADALITRLGNVRQIIVRPTSAVRQYADGGRDLLAIGRQQGVDAVLDGSLQRAGGNVRLTAQLVNVADGATLWSGRFDENFTDIFAVQDSISERVACDLVTRICGESNGRPAGRGRVDIEAYEAYLRGRYFWNKRTRDGYQRAVEYFNRAIEMAPTYAPAYSGLSDALAFLGGHDPASQAEAVVRARAAALKALEFDETLADAHASLGLLDYESDFPEAERQFRRAIELNPNHATAHQWYGEFLAYMGRFDEALAEINRAHEIDPLSLIISTDVAKVYTLARRYDRAIEQYKKTLEVEPDFDEARGLLGVTYAFAGRAEDAIAEFRKVKDLRENPLRLASLGYAYGAAGRRREAQGVRARLEELARRAYVAPYCLTFIDVGLGEKERVFTELEQMVGGHPAGKITLKVNPLYDGLRADPRFAGLLRRAGFVS